MFAPGSQDSRSANVMTASLVTKLAPITAAVSCSRTGREAEAPVLLISDNTPVNFSKRCSDPGCHSPSVTSSTLICSSAAARTSWTGDRMAVSVSIRASLSPCWTEPGRALPAALMPAVFSPAARYSQSTSSCSTTTRGGATSHGHRGEARQCMETRRRGFCGRKCVCRPVRPTCFSPFVFVFIF